ncbi:MAG: glycosyltransferase family 2 protein [Bdellovibrionota bacterium]
MYRNKKISLVIPAFREEKLIDQTLTGIPELIDRIYVVDDCSPDNQNAVIERCAQQDPRIHLLKHEINQGPGGAIITGYLQSSRDDFDIAVVVGGDFQMNLNEVSRFLDPIIDGQADYTKGNRFLREQLEKTIGSMPKLRLIANWLITGLTKMASGYFNIMDVVDGYTAISKEAIDTINWSRAWKRYGYPMDFLIRLNAYCFRVKDIPRSAIYLPGVRQSQINGWKYALQVTPMLVRNFLWRLKFKYVYLDFHPLVLFYMLAFLLVPTGLLAGLGLIADKLFFEGPTSPLRVRFSSHCA